VPQEVFEKLQPYFDANRTCIGTIFAQGGGNRTAIGRKVFESLAFHGFSMKRGCLELFGIFFPTCSFRCRKQFLKKCHLRVLQWRPCARVCTAHIWATCTSRGSGKQHVPVVQNIGAVTAKHKKKAEWN